MTGVSQHEPGGGQQEGVSKSNKIFLTPTAPDLFRKHTFGCGLKGNEDSRAVCRSGD